MYTRFGGPGITIKQPNESWNPEPTPTERMSGWTGTVGDTVTVPNVRSGHGCSSAGHRLVARIVTARGTAVSIAGTQTSVSYRSSATGGQVFRHGGATE